MPCDAAIALLPVCSLALGLGCVMIEPIHRPPTPAEIDQVNSVSPLVVELLPGTGPSLTIDRVVFADAATIVVAPENGPPYSLRFDQVSYLSKNRRDIGAAIGAGVGAGIAALFFVPFLGDASQADIGPFMEIALEYAAIGALIGALAGSRQLFLPVPRAAAPSPPPRPNLDEKSAASVVAASAEVRSAPSNEAPVIAVLPKGKALLVDATSNAGWRVVPLRDGRVGYIQDAQIKVDSPE